MSPAAVRTQRRRNHALWIGPVLTFFGAVSYFTVFVHVPALRDVPWLNIPLVLIGVAVSAVGLLRANGRSARFRGKLLGSAGFGLSAVLAALFFVYVFHYSYRLPPPTSTSLALDRIGDFALTDQAGRTLRLGDLRGRKVLIVFYRGHW